MTASRIRNPLVSVVVVNWNGSSLLDECLDSLSNQTWLEREFILVDNGSSDGSRELVRCWSERLPNAQALLLPNNTGFCRASASSWSSKAARVSRRCCGGLNASGG